MTNSLNGLISQHKIADTNAITNATTNAITIGVLGCGFVGEQVLRQFNWANQHHRQSWFTHRVVGEGSGGKVINDYQVIGFDIDNQSTWQNLPQSADCLLVTFAPTHKNTQDEALRLTNWCQWMQVNRAGIKRLIYISTTGVYPELPGHFDEHSPCKPSHLRGELRLISEQVFGQFFDVVTIRCGGIYGPKRNIISKIHSGKAIFAGNKKVYRIHVEDLTNMVALIATNWPARKVFHGVDSKSASQDEVIEWLKTQTIWADLASNFKLQDKRLDGDGKPRIIAQQNLLAEFGYVLQYPTFEVGFKVKG